jgi:hypothetical protein
MKPRELLVAVLRHDDLTARQLVKDAAREGFAWSKAPPPDFPQRRAKAVYASLVELFASRAGEQPPAWTSTVEAAPAPVFLVKAAKQSRAMRRYSLTVTPEVLKKRNVFALGDYLAV